MGRDDVRRVWLDLLTAAVETGQLAPGSTVLADKGRRPVGLSELDEESTT